MVVTPLAASVTGTPLLRIKNRRKSKSIRSTNMASALIC